MGIVRVEPALPTSSGGGNSYLSSAVPNYTGRKDTTGTGTDARATLQADLDAASSVVAGSYYNYLNRRSTTVRLAPGHYVFTAPTTGPTLKIPPGVLLDCTDATLYFDYPATARASWCGIEVGQYGQLQLGKLYPSLRTSLPDSALVYDAVRLNQTDSNSRVTGYADSEIMGWSGGAGIRGVGSWISVVSGLRITRNAYGYVASEVGTAYGYTILNGGSTRTHTDLRINDCHFVSNTRGAFLGVVSGASGSPNTNSYTFLSLTLGIWGTVFESQSTWALQVYSANSITLVDCAFEEVGATGQSICYLDNCRQITAIGTRINIGALATVPGPSGDAVANPSWMFQVTSTSVLTVQGMYVYNDRNASFQLVQTAPTVGYTVSGVRSEGAFAVGPMFYGDGMTSVAGTWNGGHLTIGSHHLWVTAAGVLRHKSTAPTSETDGTAIT